MADCNQSDAPITFGLRQRARRNARVARLVPQRIDPRQDIRTLRFRLLHFRLPTARLHSAVRPGRRVRVVRRVSFDGRMQPRDFPVERRNLFLKLCDLPAVRVRIASTGRR